MRELSLTNSRLDKRYDVHRRLGQGSYAEIFVASDIMASPTSPHKIVVLKALNVFLQDDVDIDLERTLIENFQNEAAALDRVRHPNIISRLGHGTARDLAGTVFHYLVLEYLAGGDMQSVIRKRELPLATAMGYIEQVCSGLGFAHRRNIIHRDIKPHNLLLTEDLTTAKIADFGVARISAADAPITRVGTNVYAPPEHSPFAQDQGTVKLTPAADIYSLAKTIYTLVTREAPRAFINAPITSLPDEYRDEEWSDTLLTALRRATDPDPMRRPQSVEELWFDLGPTLEIIAESETNTVLRSLGEMPQPHVSRGYSPLTPAQPSFEAVLDSGTLDPDLLGLEVGGAERSSAVADYPAYSPIERQPLPVISAPNPEPVLNAPYKPKRKRKTLRRFVYFAIFVMIFSGALYGTAVYFRNSSLISTVRNIFVSRTAVANTDINLRPDPSTDNDPIGLVTKNSKLKIVNSQNNWYQVDVIEQGRPPRPGTPSSTRGWLNSKYIDIDDN